MKEEELSKDFVEAVTINVVLVSYSFCLSQKFSDNTLFVFRCLKYPILCQNFNTCKIISENLFTLL
jgi:hypothetical protein